MSKLSKNCEGVEMLIFGTEHYAHLLRVKEQLTIWLGTKIGAQGRFLQDQGYTPLLPTTVATILADYPADVPHPDDEEQAILKRALMTEYVKERAKLGKFYETCFSTVLTLLPDKFLSEVKKDEEYLELMEGGDDPLALWTVIERIQTSGHAGGTPVERKMDAIARRQSVCQAEGLDLLSYRELFDSAQACAVANGATAVPDDEQAMDFLMRANRKLFGACVNSMQENVARGLEDWPLTVDGSFKVLNDYANIKARQASKVTSKPGSIQGDRATGFVAVAPSIAAIAVSGEPSPGPVKIKSPCGWCGKENHHEDNCFTKQKAKKEARAASAKTAKERAKDSSGQKVISMVAAEADCMFFGCYTGSVVDSDSDDEDLPVLTSDPDTDDESDGPPTVSCDPNYTDCSALLRYTDSLSTSVSHTDSSDSSGSVSEPKSDSVLPAHDQEADHIAAASTPHSVHRSIYVWDTGCTHHMSCNSEVTSDIMETSDNKCVTGIAGKMRVKYTGVLPIFGETLFDKDLPMNLISSDRVEQRFRVDRIQGVSYTVHVSPDMKVVFRRRPDGLYVCEDLLDIFQKILGQQQGMAMVSVSSNKLKYTAQEIKRADEAERLMVNLGICSYADAIRLLHAGSIMSCPVTSQDVVRHKAIYGDLVYGLKGRMFNKGPVGIHRGEPTLAVARDLVGHTDVVFFEQVPILVTVYKPINLIMATDLGETRTAATLKACLGTQVGVLRDRGFQVTSIYSDAESNFGSSKAKLGDIPIHQAGAGSHEPVVERSVRLIKERCRSLISSLPFPVPRGLIKYLVFYICNRINCTIRDSGIGVPAREAFRGIKLDYKLDMCCSFGDYAEVYVKSSQVSKSRGRSCLALHSIDNGRGSWKFLDLDKKEIVTSDNFRVLPTPQAIVDKINAMAAAETQSAQFILERTAAMNAPTGVPERVEVVLAPTNAGNETGGATADAGGATTADDGGATTADDGGATTADDGGATTADDEGVNTTDEGDVTTDVTTDGGSVTVNNVSAVSYYAFLQLSMKKGLAKHSEVAEAAIAAELKQLCEKQVWTPVHFRDLTPAERKSTIRCFIFLKEKYGQDGAMDRLKARLVAGGDQQDKSVIYTKSSPTVATESQFMLYAIAASERRHFQSVDIEGAFLDVDWSGETVIMLLEGVMVSLLYMLYPGQYETYTNHKGQVYVRLLKALYGCVQSAYLFYAKLKGVLESLGYTVNPTDVCVFNKTVSGTQSTVAFHVDDLFISHASEDDINAIADSIEGKFTAIKRQGQGGVPFMHLGVNVQRTENGDVLLSMPQYTRSCVEAFGVKKGTRTPAVAELFDIDEDSPLLSTDQAENFHTAVAKLLYLTKRTRPDILVAISWLAGRVRAPSEQDWRKLKRVFEYLSVTLEFGIKFEGGSSIDPKGWGDAAYLCHERSRSRSGAVVKMCGGVVATGSAKQKMVCKSSTESELVALCGVTTWLIICREFLVHQGHVLPPSIVYQDNQSVLALVKAGKPTSHNTKHIKMRFFFVVQHIEDGEIVLEWCPTGLMIADALTKPLVGELFLVMRDNLVSVVSH